MLINHSHKICSHGNPIDGLVMRQTHIDEINDKICNMKQNIEHSMESWVRRTNNRERERERKSKRHNEHELKKHMP